MAETWRITQRGKAFEVYPGGVRAFWEIAPTWEQETYAVFERFLDGEHSYVDVGAWVGPTVLYGGQIAKRVVAVEPDPVAYAELVANLGLNPAIAAKVTALNVGVAAKTGPIRLGSNSKGGDSMSSVLLTDAAMSWTVEGVAFEELMARHDVRDCSFIKIDIEGGEYAVLPTMVGYLRKWRPTVYVSLHPFAPEGLGRTAEVGTVMDRARRMIKTWRLMRALRFYKYWYDASGKRVGMGEILRQARENVGGAVVATDVEW